MTNFDTNISNMFEKGQQPIKVTSWSLEKMNITNVVYDYLIEQEY